MYTLLDLAGWPECSDQSYAILKNEWQVQLYCLNIMSWCVHVCCFWCVFISMIWHAEIYKMATGYNHIKLIKLPYFPHFLLGWNPFSIWKNRNSKFSVSSVMLSVLYWKYEQFPVAFIHMQINCLFVVFSQMAVQEDCLLHGC